jgi:hypothetical protein
MLSKKKLLAFGLIVGSVILLSSFQNAQSTIKEIGGYVEVRADGLAYVPSDAAYVKYNGVIRKVVEITDFISLDEDKCECPDCCDGFCYVIIYTDPGLAAEPGSCSEDESLQIKFLWMLC